MPIYKYTLLKYMKSLSTWIIAGISVLMIVVLGGFLPWHFFRSDNYEAPEKYGRLSIMLVSGMTSFLAIFTSIFSGFKAATMYKDEVENGTFLVMLSKPIQRNQIVTFKWLSLQTTLLLYTFIIAMTFLFSIIGFDKGKSIVGLEEMGIHRLSSSAAPIAFILWGILFLISSVLSSISLLISTKLSTGATIGIASAIGVVIPATAFVATFTSRAPYTSISKNIAANLEAQHSKFLENANGQNISHLTEGTLYGLGMETKLSDTFDFGKFFDINYQIRELSGFAYDEAISSSFNNALLISTSNSGSATSKASQVTKVGIAQDNQFTNQKSQEVSTFNKLIYSSWQSLEPYRFSIMHRVTNLVLKHQNEITGDFHIKAGKDEWNLKPADVINVLKQPYAALPLDYQFNKQVNIWKYALAPLSEWEGLWEKGNKDQKDTIANVYFVANRFVQELASILDTKTREFIAGGEDRTILEENAAQLKSIQNPIAYWMNIPRLEKNRLDTYRVLEEGAAQDNMKEMGILWNTVLGFNAHDYEEVVSAIHNDYRIVKIESTTYMKKTNILIVYLVLALLLVPASYLMIRRQDFR